MQYNEEDEISVQDTLNYLQVKYFNGWNHECFELDENGNDPIEYFKKNFPNRIYLWDYIVGRLRNTIQEYEGFDALSVCPEDFYGNCRYIFGIVVMIEKFILDSEINKEKLQEIMSLDEQGTWEAITAITYAILTGEGNSGKIINLLGVIAAYFVGRVNKVLRHGQEIDEQILIRICDNVMDVFDQVEYFYTYTNK